MNWVIKTPRLRLRKITPKDFSALCSFLQDAQVMYAWEHPFTDRQVTQWIAENTARYKTDGFSYYAAVEKDSAQLVGVIGPLMEEIRGQRQVGVGYILKRKFWGKGYALEGASACVEHAFTQLSTQQVVALIRPSNQASRRVAEKLGMMVQDSLIRIYNGVEMPHLVYGISKDQWQKKHSYAPAQQ